jgi:hypothetical protein
VTAVKEIEDTVHVNPNRFSHYNMSHQ